MVFSHAVALNYELKHVLYASLNMPLNMPWPQKYLKACGKTYGLMLELNYMYTSMVLPAPSEVSNLDKTLASALKHWDIIFIPLTEHIVEHIC